MSLATIGKPGAGLALVIPVAVAVVIGLAFLVGQNLKVSPSPEPPLVPSPTEATSPTASLLQPGESVELSAVDVDGEWGTIRIERGQDLGGYEDAVISPGTFIIEFFVEYEAHRVPNPAQLGYSDWALRPTDPDAERFFLIEPEQFERERGAGVRPQMALGLYLGAIDILTIPTEGRIAFEVPRREANLELELVYLPSGIGETAAITVRVPGPPPDPVALITPAPLPGDPVYVERDGLPITVIESPQADDLFSRPDMCTNPEVGYAVTFPDDWYTNTEIGAVSACSWFTPWFFEVVDESETPDEIWISIGVIDGVIGYIGTTNVFISEEVTIDGRSARRVEYNPNPSGEPSYRRYHYVILLGGEAEGPTFVAGTDTDMTDDYELARAVLDRIMASLEFEP